MPLTLRTVEPTDVSLNRIPVPTPGRHLDELQCVANGTLANIMRQLGTLSFHGAQMFEDLNKNLELVDRRLEALGLRSTSLQEKIQMGAGSSQDSDLHENLRRKPYQTANDIDQHSLSRQTMPAAMMELYNQCDAPPRLRDLDQFREDGKSALKFYTDPGYFFELWKEQILRECQNDRRMRSARVSSAAANLAPGQKSPTKRRRNQEQTARRVPHNSQVLLNNHSGAYHEYRSVSGILRPVNEFVQFPTEYQAPQISRSNRNAEIPTGMSRPQIQKKLSTSDLYDDEPLPPPPLNYRPPQVASQLIIESSHLPTTSANVTTSNDIELAQQRIQGMHIGSAQSTLPMPITTDSPSFAQQILDIDADEDELPPPPPPLNSSSQSVYPSQTPLSTGLQFLAPATLATETIQVAPAAAPAVPISLAESQIGNSSFQRDGEPTQADATANATGKSEKQPVKLSLFDELRAGKKLKKVQREEQARIAAMNPVAELLKRRMALGYSENGSSDEEAANEGNDSEWDD